jgi:hypothetical protein
VYSSKTALKTFVGSIHSDNNSYYLETILLTHITNYTQAHNVINISKNELSFLCKTKLNTDIGINLQKTDIEIFLFNILKLKTSELTIKEEKHSISLVFSTPESFELFKQKLESRKGQER